MTEYNIKEILWPERTFIVKKDKVSFDKLSSFFAEQYGAIYSGLAKKGIFISEPPQAFYYGIDETKKETVLAAAVPVKNRETELQGFSSVTFPASMVIATLYTGAYENMKPAYEAMDRYMAEKGYKKELIIEEYLSDPKSEKDLNKQKTNIYFMVKK